MKEKKSAVTRKAERVNSFFAGIGGFDLALESQGLTPIFYCENNDFCRSVLRRHWPDMNNASDIRELNSKDIPEAEIWTAGFPCQDLSLARTPHGKRSGLSGARSGLFYTFLDHLSVHKPRIVLLENVAGLLNSHKGADFNALILALTNLGYAVAWRVLNARYFGVPQSRPRVFICAWYKSPQNAVKTLFEEGLFIKPKGERLGFLTESKCKDSGISVPQISFCISATSGRHTGLDWARSYVTYKDAVRRLTPLECERLQGFPDNWTMPDKDYVIPIKGIETNRYHAIGNAVCVPVAKWIASRISEVVKMEEISSIKNYKKSSIEKQLQYLATNFLSTKSELQKLDSESIEWKWKSSGIAYKGYVTTESGSSSPIVPISSYLIDLVDKGQVHRRYFLSSNAMQGILRRVDKLGRNLYPPMDAVLRKIVANSPDDIVKNPQNKRKIAIL